MDVGAGPEPAGDSPGIIKNRYSPDQMPSVGLLPRIQEPNFHLERCAALEGFCPTYAGGLSVIGVQYALPALVTHRLWQPGEFRPPAIQVVNITVRACSPDDLRHGVGELPEPLLGIPQGDFRALPLAHVPEVD